MQAALPGFEDQRTKGPRVSKAAEQLAKAYGYKVEDIDPESVTQRAVFDHHYQVSGRAELDRQMEARRAVNAKPMQPWECSLEEYCERNQCDGRLIADIPEGDVVELYGSLAGEYWRRCHTGTKAVDWSDLDAQRLPNGLMTPEAARELKSRMKAAREAASQREFSPAEIRQILSEMVAGRVAGILDLYEATKEGRARPSIYREIKKAIEAGEKVAPEALTHFSELRG